ncbi:hypothetical protein ACFLYH_00405 [Candidatus Dependentiae bacterium]
MAIKIKKLFRIKSFFLTLVSIGFIFLSTKLLLTVKKTIQNTFMPKHIKLKISSIYSQKIKSDLKAFFNKNINNEITLNMSINSLCSNFKKKFAIVKTIKWNFDSPGFANLKIKGTKPILKINNTFILCDNKKIFDIQSFKNFNLDKLKNIYISANYIDLKFKNPDLGFINNLPKRVVEQYEINYLKNSYIALTTQHKNWKKKDFFIIGYNFLSNKKLITAEFINKNLKSNNQHHKGYSFDLRFKDRVYVKPVHREGLKFAQIMGRE